MQPRLNLRLKTVWKRPPGQKIISSPLNPVPSKGCVDLTSAGSYLQLNASALSNSNSLYVDVTSSFTPEHFRALVDSGSSHCFVDPKFVNKKKNSNPSDPSLTPLII